MKKNKETKVKTRTEKDTMGSVNVPTSALFGAQTQRAIDNFPISNHKFMFDFIKAVTIIKRSAALTNYKLDLIKCGNDYPDECDDRCSSIPRLCEPKSTTHCEPRLSGRSR